MHIMYLIPNDWEQQKYIGKKKNVLTKSCILTINAPEKLKSFLKIFDKEIKFTLICLSQ